MKRDVCSFWATWALVGVYGAVVVPCVAIGLCAFGAYAAVASRVRS